MSRSLVKFLSLVLLLAGFSALSYAEGIIKDGKQSLSKVNGTPSSIRLNINQVSSWFYNNGISDINNTGNAGFVYPKGSGKTAFFQSGFVWGGKVDGNIRVGGSTYQGGVLPGAVKNGVPEDPASPNVRIYRVRRDYKTGSMFGEIAEGEGSEPNIRARYENDWMSWPASDGAPFDDVDGNGKYDPQVDIPGVPGADQTIWYVNNDFDTATVKSLYGSLPLGLECQTTVWGYNMAGPIGNMLFRKYKLINKSKRNITDMYVSMWSDPDLGDPTDDLAGCDTTLSMTYVYNGRTTDKVYGSNPPAAGFDLLQGPLVPGSPSDTAIFNGKKITGKRNLPMTAFYYFVNGTLYMDPDTGDHYLTGTLSFYRLLQGKMSTQDNYFPVPPQLGGGVTKFPLSGDPTTATGYLDGMIFDPGDRRFGLSSGPFTMAVGDTQEVVFAQMAAGGPGTGQNSLDAVKTLKNYDRKVQDLYNNMFQPPSNSWAPSVKVSELDKEVILDWGSNYNQVSLTESFNDNGFKFEGYNVYQLPSPTSTRKEAKRVATYDLADGVKIILGDVVDPETGVILKAVQQYGNDSGIKRYFGMDWNYLTNQPLENGKDYYFAVTAYAFNPDSGAVPNNIENPLSAIKVTPHAPGAGETYKAHFGDTVAVKRISGKTDALVVALVVDPKSVTGHSYQVTFDTAGVFNPAKGHFETLYEWKVTDLRRNAVVISNQTNLSGDEDYLTVDGLLIKVIGTQKGVKPGDPLSTSDSSAWGWSIPGGERLFSWDGAAEMRLEGFHGAIGAAATWLGSSVGYDNLKNVVVKFAAADSNGNVNPDDHDVSFAYRYLRGSSLAPENQEFIPFIINKGTGYAFQDFKKNFPFAVYDVEDSQHPRRLAVGYLENNSSHGLVNGKYWPPVDGIDNVSQYSPREWFFIFDTGYSETPDASLQNDLLLGTSPVLLHGTVTRKTKGSWKGNDEMAIYVYHMPSPLDVFRIDTDYLSSVKPQDIPLTYDLEQNYPNPFNPVTNIRYTLSERSHVELKVFDILGREVMTLVNNEQNAGRYTVQFDGNGLSSGIYIYRLSSNNFTKSSKMVLLK